MERGKLAVFKWLQKNHCDLGQGPNGVIIIEKEKCGEKEKMPKTFGFPKCHCFDFLSFPRIFSPFMEATWALCGLPWLSIQWLRKIDMCILAESKGHLGTRHELVELCMFCF